MSMIKKRNMEEKYEHAIKVAATKLGYLESRENQKKKCIVFFRRE